MKRLFTVAAMVAALMTVLSCNKYEDALLSPAVRKNSKVMPPKSVSDEMPVDKLQLPEGARDVEWDKEGPYWELSYKVGYGANKVEVEVYFDSEGNWVMTKTEMRMKDVPSYIKDYVTSSPEYADAVFCDVDAEYIERPEGNSYVFEISINRIDIDLEVTESGEITIVN